MASIPKTCKAAVMEKANAGLVIKDVPVKQPGSGEVLLKVKACGVCHSDMVVSKGAFGDWLFPRIPGHEIIGDVVAVGPDVKQWKVGDRLGSGWHGGHDGTCKSCQRGNFQLCGAKIINGVHREGGYAEYATLRAESCAPVPRSMDPALAAPLMCAGVTLFNSVRKMGIAQGDVVAVQGIGGLGHLGLQYVRKMGYHTVALSGGPSKKDLALKLGAHDYLSGTPDENAAELQKTFGGAALIVCTAPGPTMIPSLLNGLAPGGKLVVLTPIGPVNGINTVPMVSKALSIQGWSSGHALDSQEAVIFAEAQGVECMIEKFPLAKANDAMKHLESGNVRFRGVLVME